MNLNSLVSLRFCVFSYNRGQFLKNCIASIEHCAPWCPVTIFDDNSDDPETCSVLAELAQKYEIVAPPNGVSKSKHGGLYANMQAAYAAAQDTELLCFLQDDMQLVRELGREEVEGINHQFRLVEGRVFIQPVFFKGCTQASDASRTRYDDQLDVYHVDRHDRSAGAFYSDVLILSVAGLRSINWHFQDRESLNESQARQHDLAQMRHLRNPFLAWLPNAPAYRGKVQTLGLKLAQHKNESGYFPFRYMTEAEAEAFVNRPASQLPVAETFLHTKNDRPVEPWIYHPLQDQRALKLLNSIELRVRRLAGR